MSQTTTTPIAPRIVKRTNTSFIPFLFVPLPVEHETHPKKEYTRKEAKSNRLDLNLLIGNGLADYSQGNNDLADIEKILRQILPPPGRHMEIYKQNSCQDSPLTKAHSQDQNHPKIRPDRPKIVPTDL